MATVFLSSDSADLQRVKELADAHGDEGIEVFWAEKIRGIEEWRRHLGDQIHRADCVLVIWSKASKASEAVIVEAAAGSDAQKLIPILIDGTPPPIGFGDLQAEDLTKWEPGVTGDEFESLVGAIRAMLPSHRTRVWRPGASPAQIGHAQPLSEIWEMSLVDRTRWVVSFDFVANDSTHRVEIDANAFRLVRLRIDGRVVDRAAKLDKWASVGDIRLRGAFDHLGTSVTLEINLSVEGRGKDETVAIVAGVAGELVARDHLPGLVLRRTSVADALREASNGLRDESEIQ